MRLKIPGILRAVQSTPWAIMPEKLEAMMELLELRAQGGMLSAEDVQARIGDAKKVPPRKQGVVAIIPVYGVVSQRMSMFSDISGGTSTEQLMRQFNDAMNDDSVMAIVFEVDSPGGSVAGVQELATHITSNRGKKPIKTVANSLMASAAYWIGSAADEVIAAPSADIGSIGVYAVHVDVSGLDEQMGVRRTLIKAGKYKAEGSPFSPLSEEARAHMQELVDDTYDAFIEAVALQRGTTPGKVRTGYGEGRVLTAKRAVQENLADRIATLDAVLEELGAMAPPDTRTRAAQDLPPDAVSEEASVVRVAVSGDVVSTASTDITKPAEAEAAEPATPARETAGALPAPIDTRTSIEPAPKAEETIMDEKDKAAGSAVTSVTDHQAEAKRTTQVYKLCAAHGLTATQAQEYVDGGKNAEEVGLDLARKSRESLHAMTAAPVELNERETRRYSIARAIVAAAGRQDGSKSEDDSFEREVSDEIRNNLPKDYKYKGGILVPHRMRASDVGRIGGGPRRFTRAELERVAQFDPALAQRMAVLNVGSATAGGNAVFTEGREMIDFLYPRMKVAALGATILSGLRGPVAFPRQTASSAWTWVAENPGSDVADSDATIGQVLLSPKTGTASTAYSRQLLTEATINVDDFVQNDLSMGAALGIDKAAIQGTGTNQPVGITGTAGVTVVALGTNGLAPTYVSVVDLETAVATANADIDTMAYLTTPGVRGVLKKTQQFSGTNGLPVWMDGEVNGYRAEVSTQVPSTLTKGSSSGVAHAIIFGVWSQLLIGYFGAYELIVDPYRLKKQGLIEVTSFQMAGIAVRNPPSFAITLDALLA